MVCICQACKYNVALINSSAEVSKTPSELGLVKKIRHAFNSDSWLVTDKSGAVRNVACESVWGIKYKDGTTYRYYKDQYYLIRQNSDIKIYSQIHGGYKSSHTSYYFSKGLDNEIYPLKWKNIKRQFETDTCFLHKIEKHLKWYQDYSLYDKKNKTYILNTFYNQCNSN